MLNTKTQKVAFNTTFQVIGKALSTIISLFIIASLTRYLGVQVYGEYTTIFSFVAFVSIIADFGFFWILVRELSKKEKVDTYFFNNVLSLKIVFSIIVFTLASLIVFLIPQYNITIKMGIAIISFSWFWSSLNSTYVGLFQTKLEMYKAVISDLVGRLVILIVVLFLIKNNYNLSYILGANVLGNLINFLVSYFYGRKYIKYKFCFDFILWKKIFKQSFPLAILTLVGTVNFRIDTIILSILKTQVDVGIYGIPYKILEIVIVIPTIFVGNTLPILTKYYHQKDIRLKQSIQKSFDFLMFLAFPIVTGLSILAIPIIKLIGGNEYINTSTLNIYGINIAAPQILIILAISIGLSFLITMFSNLIIVAKKQKSQVFPMIVVTIINVVLNIIFIPKLTYLAASLFTFLSNIMLAIWWYCLAHKYIKFKIKFNIFKLIILATFIMSISVYFLRNYNLFLNIFISSIIYLYISYVLKIFDKETLLKLLPNLIKKQNEK